MSTTIEAFEVDDFRFAIERLELDYVRTDAGTGPCRVTVASSPGASFSTGTIGFSSISHTDVPDDTVSFNLITSTPQGGAWCGIDLGVGQLTVYAPGTSFVGVNPTGLSAAILVVESTVIHDVAAAMSVIPVLRQSVVPLPPRPEVLRLKRALWQASNCPDSLDDATTMQRVVEAAVLALSDSGSRPDGLGRRLDSRKIVLDCLEYVKETGSTIPSMRELCGAASASESRVRHAFVEILDTSPTQYFQYRLLSQLRDDLLRADPHRDTVTRIASSLGVTQLGRIAGRYHRLFDELPNETLRR